MKRKQYFEFEDFPWFPDSLRQMMTLYIVAFHRLLGTAGRMAPLVARALAAGRTSRVVDLCSGGGGPVPELARRLREEHDLDVSVTLTDLYPNRTAAAAIAAAGDARVTYRTQPVDAADVPAELTGVRTMVASFHHMRPETARRILADAFAKRQPFCLYEISDNAVPTLVGWATLPLAVLLVLLFTPLVRPLSWRQLLLTYVVPILPLVIAWDGTASNLRTYTLDDLRELLRGLDAPDYQWEPGFVQMKGFPGKFLYLLGLPVSRP